MPRLPYPSGAYHPSLAPTPQQREQMLEGKDEIAQAQLKTRWMRYEYVPSPDAIEYDGPHDPFGDPDFVCYKRWEVSRREQQASAPVELTPKRPEKPPIGVWPSGTGREVMGAVMDFSNRYEDDFAHLKKKGVKMPHALSAYLGELICVVDDVAFNGGFNSDWGSRPKDVRAQRAAVRILARVVMELGELLDMKPEPEDEPLPDLGEVVSDCVAKLQAGTPVEGMPLAIAHLSNVAFPKKEGSIYAGNPFDSYKGKEDDMIATLAGIRLGRICFDRIEGFAEAYMEENGLSLEGGEA